MLRDELYQALCELPAIDVHSHLNRDRMAARGPQDLLFYHMLLYVLRGIEETALWTTGRIQAIRDLFEETLERCRRKLPKVYSKELIELIFRQPYCKIQFLVGAGVAKRQTASTYLQQLESIGILVSEKRGREMIYKHPALLDVLTA
jgi:Fic family protein